MLVMIDNYDSFTYNLVQYFGELGAEVRVVRNDQVDLDGLRALRPTRLVVSPGPCTPDQAGISMEAIRHYGERIPVLGVCLGHQCIGQVYGGRIVHAQRIMHGKMSPIHHRSEGVFAGLPSPFEATRYHSLVIDQASVPEILQVTAWTLHEDGRREEIMGVRHGELAVQGVQFHPESITSEHGHQLLRNFLNQ